MDILNPPKFNILSVPAGTDLSPQIARRLTMHKPPIARKQRRFLTSVHNESRLMRSTTTRFLTFGVITATKNRIWKNRRCVNCIPNCWIVSSDWGTVHSDRRLFRRGAERV